ncbi:conserved hypothetical protein [Xylella fastidiosa M12]|nr:conserved hypothetical protein [Xylella fastidiosa M12]
MMLSGTCTATSSRITPLPLQRNRTHQHITDAIDWKHTAAQRKAISPHFIVT